MIVEYCKACERKITCNFDGDFNYTKEETGPYCDTCWFFIREIENLHNRITALEEK